MPAAARDAFALVFALLAVGWSARRFALFGEQAAGVLNRVVLYVCLPAAVLLYTSKLTLGPEVVGLVAVPWLLLAASVPVITLVARLLRLAEEEKAVLLLCVPLGNTAFLGYPLVAGLLGPEALPPAVLYDQLGSFPMLSTWGLWVLARYAPRAGAGGPDAAPPSLSSTLARLARFPPFVALVLALLVMPSELPTAAHTLLARLADAQLPLVALAVGLQLELRLPRGELAPLAAGLVLKLGLLPALAWALVRLFAIAPPAAGAAVLESAMPPMITAAGFAIAHRLAPRLAAAMVAYGVLAALLTLPLWLRLL